MSIVPVPNERGVITTTTNSSSGDLWDVPEEFFPLDLWDPFRNSPLPFMLSTHFPSSIFPSFGTQVSWRETPRAHVFRAVFSAGSNGGEEDVLVYVDDDNMLQISTENGNFLSKFKLPQDAKRDEIKASMANGVLTVTVPKAGAGARAGRRNVRVVDISGSG